MQRNFLYLYIFILAFLDAAKCFRQIVKVLEQGSVYAPRWGKNQGSPMLLGNFAKV